MNSIATPTPVTNPTEHTCSAKPKSWNCWACHDTNTDHSLCGATLDALRRENWNQCISCPSRNFKEGSLMCMECHDIIEKNNIYVSSHPCLGGCGRYGSHQPFCRFCRELGKDEEEDDEFENYVPAYVDRTEMPPIKQFGSVSYYDYTATNPWDYSNAGAIAEGRPTTGCLGCGEPGYTNDYCSRVCMKGPDRYD